jgi:DNA-directed RNA polymerase specialized sigma24 family protein
MVKPKRKTGESIEAYNERASKLYYKEGYNIKEIAGKLNIEETEVYNYVAKGHKATTEAEREEMISLYNKGYTYCAIAKIIGKSYSCVRSRIERPAKIHCQETFTLTDKQLNKMIDLANKGYGVEYIAKELKVKSSVIKHRLEHADRYNKTYTLVTKPEINTFIRLHKKGKSYGEIAKICGRSKTTVSKHIREYYNKRKK